MTTDAVPTGPDPEAITRILLERYPDTVIAQAMGATFFSLDASHWPNYATIVTTDEHDEGAPSNLSARPGAFRLNMGLGRASYDRLVAGVNDPDYAAFDRFVPHPVYARQRWVSIVNPSDATFRDHVLPLLDEAHDRLASQRSRQRK
jgi:hypothetical protein